MLLADGYATLKLHLVVYRRLGTVSSGIGPLDPSAHSALTVYFKSPDCIREKRSFLDLFTKRCVFRCFSYINADNL